VGDDHAQDQDDGVDDAEGPDAGLLNEETRQGKADKAEKDRQEEKIAPYLEDPGLSALP